jgi:hypothetical protein
MIQRITILALLFLVCGCSRKPAADAQAERDRDFQQMMSGTTLVGYSTRTNRTGLSGEERYTVEKVSKMAGDTWLFHTRLKYGSTDLPVPIPLTVRWAGDTPVITLTDLSIPGLGTFTARVLLYRDQYAGTWSAEKGGGQLFGRIVRNETPAASPGRE